MARAVSSSRCSSTSLAVGHVMFGLCEAKQMFVFKTHAFFLSTLMSTDQRYTGYKYFNNTNYANVAYDWLIWNMASASNTDLSEY